MPPSTFGAPLAVAEAEARLAAASDPPIRDRAPARRGYAGRSGVPGIDCGSGQPTLFTLEQGISVRWGDNYDPHKEGQHIDLTGVKAGRYYVAHRVVPAKRLHEVTRDNNAASALPSVRWPRGKRRPPRVKLIAECPRGNRCTGPRLYFTVPLRRGPAG